MSKGKVKGIEVVIIQRSESKVYDQELYDKVHSFMYGEAQNRDREGVLSQTEIIASHTRVLQQLAANATQVAESMGIELDSE